MPLDAEFKTHLHSLMVEVSEQTSEEAARHKAELVYKAYQTHNGAAPPIAYKDAKLFAMKLRVGKMIERYIEAVAGWGFPIDARFERDMIQEFWSLTAGSSHFDHPPMMGGNQQHIQAVQASFARERSRLASQLVREGANRLKELKMKNKREQQSQVTHNTTNNINFNAPVQNAFVNSPNSSVVQTNNITITAQILDDLDRLSAGNPELQSAAGDVRAAHAEGGNWAERLLRWATLATSVEALGERFYQHYPQLVALIQHLRGN